MESNNAQTAPVAVNETNIILTSVAEQSIAPCARSTISLLVSLKAPFFEENNRVPIDLVTVIDRSGSMGGSKMELVKDTLKFVAKQLKPDDRLSIVVYDHEVSVTYPLTNMDATGKEKATQAIQQITARGSTDLCGGLLAGIDVISNRQQKNEVASVLLFTDGLTNAGIQNVEEIVSEMSKKAAAPTASAPLGVLPCSVHTFGFGSDHDVNILKAIADRGSGTYFFIENKDTIADAFADCLGGLLSVVAQNISLEIEGVNGSVVDKVNTSYATKKEEFHYVVAIGDIQSEEERDILAAITLPSSEPHEQISIVRAKICYFNVVTSKQVEHTCNCVVARNNDVTTCTYNLKVDSQRNRLLTAEALSFAKKKGDTGDYKAAREEIERVKQIIKNSKTANDPFVVSLLKDLDTSYAGLQDRQTYTTYGGYTVSTFSSAHCQQRSTQLTPAYTTHAKGHIRAQLDQ